MLPMPGGTFIGLHLLHRTKMRAGRGPVSIYIHLSSPALLFSLDSLPLQQPPPLLNYRLVLLEGSFSRRYRRRDVSSRREASR